MSRNPGLSLAVWTLEDLSPLNLRVTAGQTLVMLSEDPEQAFVLWCPPAQVLTCFPEHALIFFCGKIYFLVVPPIIC